MYLINMFHNHIKASCARYDLDLMFELTQLVTTSKAHRQTGVNLVVKLVTFTMDVTEGGLKLSKKHEKLRWQVKNKVLPKPKKIRRRMRLSSLRNK